MPPFRYKPNQNRYVGSIADLMGRGNEAEARALIASANAQAQAAQASGQAWGGAVQGIGNIVSQGITDWNSPEARRQRELDEARKVYDEGAREVRDVTDTRYIAPTVQSSILPGTPTEEGPPFKFTAPEPYAGQEPADMIDRYPEPSLPVLPTRETYGPGLSDPALETITREVQGYLTDDGFFDPRRATSKLVDAGTNMSVINELMDDLHSNNKRLAEWDALETKNADDQTGLLGKLASTALRQIEAGVVDVNAGIALNLAPLERRFGEKAINDLRVKLFGLSPEQQIATLTDAVKAADDVTEFGQNLYDVTLDDESIILGASQVDGPGGERFYVGPNGDTLAGIKSVREQEYRGNFGGGAGSELGDVESSVDFANFDPSTRNMLQHAGLNLNEMLVAIGQTSRLPRGWRRDRAISGANQWFADKGIDPSTMAAEFDAYNDALKFNVRKFNLVRNAETEIYEDIQNLRQVIDRLGLDDVQVFNQIKAWTLGQVTDPRASEYLFLINQLQNDLTLYNQASQGGGTQAPTDALRNEAKEMIRAGASQGTLDGLLGGLERSIAGMTVVNQEALNRIRQRVWGLFGVGHKYDSVESGVPEVRSDYVRQRGPVDIDIPTPSSGDAPIGTSGTGTQPTGDGVPFDPFALSPAVPGDNEVSIVIEGGGSPR